MEKESLETRISRLEDIIRLQGHPIPEPATENSKETAEENEGLMYKIRSALNSEVKGE